MIVRLVVGCVCMNCPAWGNQCSPAVQYITIGATSLLPLEHLDLVSVLKIWEPGSGTLNQQQVPLPAAFTPYIIGHQEHLTPYHKILTGTHYDHSSSCLSSQTSYHTYNSAAYNSNHGLASTIIVTTQVTSEEEVRAVFRAVAGEVPGSPIFAMKLAPQSRHLEVRMFANVCEFL